MAKGKSPMARTGKSNGRWKSGRSKSYRRKKMGCKTGDGTIIHHKDHNKSNNKKSNFKKIKPGKGISATGKHNKAHPEKGRK